MTENGPSSSKVRRALGRRAGETAAAWLERLLVTDVSGHKTVRAAYQLLVAKAKRQARLEAGKRPLKPRTEAERMAAAAAEVGTGEGGEPELERMDGPWEKIDLTGPWEKIDLAGTKSVLRSAAPRGRRKKQ
jgi:hypothetical protein